MPPKGIQSSLYLYILSLEIDMSWIVFVTVQMQSRIQILPWVDWKRLLLAIPFCTLHIGHFIYSYKTL